MVTSGLLKTHDYDTVRRDLMRIRAGHGLPDPAPRMRVNSTTIDCMARVVGRHPQSSEELALLVETTVMKLLNRLPEDLREVGLADFNRSERISGVSLTDRQGSLARIHSVDPKTIQRRSAVVLSSLVTALLTWEPEELIEIDSSAIESVIVDIAQWARPLRNPDGGIPSDNAGSLSGAWATAGLTWGLTNAGAVPSQEWVEESLWWIHSQRSDDHGVPIVARGDLSVTDATAQTALAAASSLAVHDNRDLHRFLVDLIGWLTSHQNAGGGWPWAPVRENVGWTATSCYALIALCESRSLLPTSSPHVDRVMRESSEWLQNLQNPSDGGWPSSDASIDSNSKVAVTGLTCFALTKCGYSFDRGKASSFLRAQLQGSNFASTIERPAGSTVVRLGVPNIVAGLASLAPDNPEIQQTLVKATQRLLAGIIDGHYSYRNGLSHTWPTRDALLALDSVRSFLESSA
jgi:hypothetical protein